MFEQLIRNIFQSYYGKQQTLTQFYYNNSNITKNENKNHVSLLFLMVYIIFEALKLLLSTESI